MTLPTVLSVSRLLLTGVVMACLQGRGGVAKAAALLVFLLASVTDWLDGYLARRWRQTSPLGALLDPLADKVLVLGTFTSLMMIGVVPAWMLAVIALREIAVTLARQAAAHRRMILPAAREGKQKMVSQVGAIIVCLAALALQEWPGTDGAPAPLRGILPWAVTGSLWLATILTATSGITFFVRYRAATRPPSR